jgi:hypothetical protein
MKTYKFKDSIDGKLAYVLAKSQTEAEAHLKTQTALPFVYIDSREVSQIDKPIILRNEILPF